MDTKNELMEAAEGVVFAECKELSNRWHEIPCECAGDAFCDEDVPDGCHVEASVRVGLYLWTPAGSVDFDGTYELPDGWDGREPGSLLAAMEDAFADDGFTDDAEWVFEHWQAGDEGGLWVETEFFVAEDE